MGAFWVFYIDIHLRLLHIEYKAIIRFTYFWELKIDTIIHATTVHIHCGNIVAPIKFSIEYLTRKKTYKYGKRVIQLV